jgi:streptomycin 6-kinase
MDIDNEKIIANFGTDFCAKVLDCLNKYTELWGLSCFEQIDVYNRNCLFKCVSDKHGLCVLKIGEDAKLAENECLVLREYNGKRLCKLYEADTTNGVLLIERIVPGIQLQHELDLDKRIDIFCVLLNGLHIKPANLDNYVSYMTLVDDMTKFMSTHNSYEELYAKMAKAQEICRCLHEKYPNEMLLHNDLYHYNILSSGDNRNISNYRIIDPVGAVVGVALFDVPGFIYREYFHGNADKMAYITNAISEKLNISARDIWCAEYVRECMNVCYSVKYGGEPNMIIISLPEKMMDDYGL